MSSGTSSVPLSDETKKAISEHIANEMHNAIQTLASKVGGDVESFKAQLMVAAQEATSNLVRPANEDYTKHLPVKPETFSGNGKREVSQWFYELETYFKAANIPERRWMDICPALLRFSAMNWWRTRVQNGKAPVDYEDFKLQLIQTFQIVNPIQNARVFLEIPDIGEGEMLDRFVRGLKNPVAQEVRVRGADTFDRAVAIAERYDSATFKRDYGGNNHHTRDNNNNGYSQGVPMELGAAEQSNGKVFNRLTPELRIQLIREGKCLYCRQPGHMALNCPNKRTQVPNHQQQ